MIQEHLTSLFSRQKIVVPSLLAADFLNLEREIHDLEKAGAQILHIDVMDGRLVPNISVGIPVVAAIRKATSLKLDVHLMIVEPDEYIDAFCDAGADLLSVHIEALTDPAQTLNRIRKRGKVPGLVLNYGTPVERILPFVSLADFVLVMSVPAGFGGQKFRYDSLDSIRAIRRAAGPDLLIEIDGGIDDDTIHHASEAGVNLFVAGTGILGAEDYADRISHLTRIARTI